MQRMLIALVPLFLLSCSGCAVDQGVHAVLTRELPDGSKIHADFERKWADGPVELHAEFDPTSGKWVVEWKSNPSLDPAAAASIRQVEAQTELISGLAKAVAAIGAAAAGLPPIALPTSPPLSPAPLPTKPVPPSKAESGGVGPPAEETIK